MTSDGSTILVADPSRVPQRCAGSHRRRLGGRRDAERAGRNRGLAAPGPRRVRQSGGLHRNRSHRRRSGRLPDLGGGRRDQRSRRPGSSPPMGWRPPRLARSTCSTPRARRRRPANRQGLRRCSHHRGGRAERRLPGRHRPVPGREAAAGGEHRSHLRHRAPGALHPRRDERRRPGHHRHRWLRRARRPPPRRPGRHLRLRRLGSRHHRHRLCRQPL